MGFEALQETVRWAYERSSFYRRRYDAAGFHPDQLTEPQALLRVPTVSKEDFAADVEQHPPFGSILAVAPEELRRVYVAPGPIVYTFTQDDYAALAEHAADALRRMGLGPGDVVDNTVQFNWVTAGTFYDEALRRAGCAAVPGGAGQSELHADYLKLTGATGILGFPTFLEHLASVARSKGIDPARDLRVRRIVFGGELRRADTKAYLSELFGGADVREHYATADVGIVAYECEYGGGMHLAGGVWTEVVDPDSGRPVGPGEAGEVVLTSLVRRAFPVVRYRTGDLTAGLDPAPCRCGATTPRMGRILGRVGNIPRVKGLFVSPREVERALAGFPELGERYQMRIERPGAQDVLTIRVECQPDAAVSPEARADLASRVAQALKSRIRITPEVELLDAGTLAPDAPLVDDRRVV